MVTKPDALAVIKEALAGNDFAPVTFTDAKWLVAEVERLRLMITVHHSSVPEGALCPVCQT